MAYSNLIFADRTDAGHRLAARLVLMKLVDPVVYVLPRGGVPVGLEIARALRAPLDVVLVRKIGAPGIPELALGAVVDGENAQVIVNETVAQETGAGAAYLDRTLRSELQEIERRRALYLAGHPRVDPAGRVAVVVDDGLATGATAKAAVQALRRQGAARIILAIPVAPAEIVAELREVADEVVCLHPARDFPGVGGFYADFHQLTDDETIRLLRAAWGADPIGPAAVSHREITVLPHGLPGILDCPPHPRGIVLFAHGSFSSRLSPRNQAVADDLNALGFATLLLDLLTEAETRDRRNVFDVNLLAGRLQQAVHWIDADAEVGGLNLGLFGASTGAAAAIIAAVELGDRVGAVVSRGGRADLAGQALAELRAPTLLIVGGADHDVIALNRQAQAQMHGETALEIVPGAGHLFEEPGTLEAVTKQAGAWFRNHLAAPRASAPAPQPPLTGLRAVIEPLPEIADPAFARMFDRFATAKLVLLGEASHGTSEFYRARAVITRHLIEHHGFSIVAVEADWPDAAAVDRYVRHLPYRSMKPPPFSRFPTWMWRNTDVHDFIHWLRHHNAAVDPAQRAGFYGLDLYNMTASIAAVLGYLDRVDPKAARVARDRYACLAPWSREPAAYGRAALDEGYALCEAPVISILRDLLVKQIEYAGHDGETFLDASQNARLVADAERYYRVMYYGSDESWNLRDSHMFETLEHVLAAKNPQAKAVVWAHNSHIGDARFTDMGQRGQLNIGQLCRERFGSQVALIGFGTNSGTVAAASDWDGPMEIKTVRPGLPESHEAVCHQTGIARFLLDLRRERSGDHRSDLFRSRLERYIGVIYRPETERLSHYSEALLAGQYDGFVWFDSTSAVTPLSGTAISAGAADETYPFGL
ncbi:MAG: erythromycin esterase family protein [Acidiphilium sp.]|nr:erythromycin esterase family protein [Acidiphilium sp.]MDD4934486.1 erythromycin esterase family protein [Acidiphilium sp.]